MKGNKNVTFSLPEPLLHEFQVYAAKRNQSMTSLMAEAIEKLVKQRDDEYEKAKRRILRTFEESVGSRARTARSRGRATRYMNVSSLIRTSSIYAHDPSADRTQACASAMHLLDTPGGWTVRDEHPGALRILLRRHEKAAKLPEDASRLSSIFGIWTIHRPDHADVLPDLARLSATLRNFVVGRSDREQRDRTGMRDSLDGGPERRAAIWDGNGPQSIHLLTPGRILWRLIS